MIGIGCPVLVSCYRWFSYLKMFYTCPTSGILKSLRYTLKLIRLTLKWLLNGTPYIGCGFTIHSSFIHSHANSHILSLTHRIARKRINVFILLLLVVCFCFLSLCTAKFDLFQFLISVVSVWVDIHIFIPLCVCAHTHRVFGYCKFFLIVSWFVS